MSLSTTTFGQFRLFTIETGNFRLDGGAMFGVVPKALWSRRYEYDDQNRIPMAARCLLAHSTETDRVYLIDTGTGHKFDDKFTKIYNLDFSAHSLNKSLAQHGFAYSDITDVVFTHMHFDHCGGAVHIDAGGNPALTFPEANHWVHRRQWDNVLHPNIREAASYFPDNIRPLESSGQLQLIGDHHIYEPGFSIEVVNGHSPGQQLPVFSDGYRTILYAADLLPTAAHLPVPWVMGFDTRPLDTFEEKKRILTKCLHENFHIYLEHDPFHELIRLEGDPVKSKVAWSGTLSDL